MAGAILCIIGALVIAIGAVSRPGRRDWEDWW